MRRLCFGLTRHSPGRKNCTPPMQGMEGCQKACATHANAERTHQGSKQRIRHTNCTPAAAGHPWKRTLQQLSCARECCCTVLPYTNAKQYMCTAHLTVVIRVHLGVVCRAVGVPGVLGHRIKEKAPLLLAQGRARGTPLHCPSGAPLACCKGAPPVCPCGAPMVCPTSPSSGRGSRGVGRREGRCRGGPRGQDSGGALGGDRGRVWGGDRGRVRGGGEQVWAQQHNEQALQVQEGHAVLGREVHWGGDL